MRKSAGSVVTLLVLAVACGSPEGPEWSVPDGSAVAWFDGLGWSLDLYFPEEGALLETAYTTGESPADIIPLGSGRFAVVNSLSSSVGFYDLDGRSPVVTDLPAGSNPYAACALGDTLFVALLLADSVAVFDAATGAVTGYLAVGGNPDAVSAVDGRLFVGHGNWPDGDFPPGVTVVDLATGQPVDTIAAPENVYGMRYFPSTGHIHAVSSTYTDDGAVTIIDPSAPAVSATIATGGSPGLPAWSDGMFVAGDGWSSDNLYEYDEGGLQSVWQTGFGVTGVAARGDTLYMTDFDDDLVLVGLLSGQVLIDTLEAGDGPQGVAIIPR